MILKPFYAVVIIQFVGYGIAEAKEHNHQTRTHLTKSSTFRSLFHRKTARAKVTLENAEGSTHAARAGVPAHTEIHVSIPPGSCKVKRFKDIKYLGRSVAGSKNVDSEEACAILCHEFNQNYTDRHCGSVNFIAPTKCELRAGELHSDDQMIETPHCVYLIPINCTKAKTPPQQRPKPPPTSSRPIVKCGVTFHEPSLDTSKRRRIKRKTARIVNGKKSVPHSLPWLVSLQQIGQHFCDGSLIQVSPYLNKTDIVLTAAHCVYEHPLLLKATVGAHKLNSILEDHKTLSVEKYIYHEQYNHTLTINDIALARLERPVEFSETIQPACIPNQGDPVPSGEIAIVAGWGTMKENTVTLPDELMQVPVPVQEDKTCHEWYPTDFVVKDMFCAGWKEGGRDSCQGDSGGPLNFKTQQGWTVKGLVSFGDGCAREKKPGVYTRLAHYRTWIDKNIKKLTLLPVD